MEHVSSEGFEPLPITWQHEDAAGRLPRDHGDPFDRMLIAQANIERLTVVTRDRALDAYGVSVLRC